MPRSYQLIVHHNNEQNVFSSEADEKAYQGLPVPDATRKSAMDAILWKELQMLWSREVQIGHLPNTADHADAISYLTKSILAYRLFVPESVNFIRLLLQSEDEYDPLAAYLKKLDVTASTAHQTPEQHLSHNIEQAIKSDALLHVRECEDIGCSLNHHGSPVAEMINQNVGDQVEKYILRIQPKKEKTIFYGSFASGLLLRDLHILKRLIQQGYQNIELFLMDKGYSNLIKQTCDAFSPLTIGEQIAIDMQVKALNEFSNWVATQTNTNEKNPLKIHICADINDAENFFKASSQKLTVLVGQDYFTKDGAQDPCVATPDAHEDFMRLAKASLASSEMGCFFELIKNDNNSQVYLHAGLVDVDGQYVPYFTTVHEMCDPFKTTAYPFTSLGFFTKQHDNPVSCEEGKMHVLHPFKLTK